MATVTPSCPPLGNDESGPELNGSATGLPDKGSLSLPTPESTPEQIAEFIKAEGAPIIKASGAEVN